MDANEQDVRPAPLTRAERERLRGLCKAATLAQPWVCETQSRDKTRSHAPEEAVAVIAPHGWRHAALFGDVRNRSNVADRNIAVAAVNALPSLLTALDAAEARVERAEGELARLADLSFDGAECYTVADVRAVLDKAQARVIAAERVASAGKPLDMDFRDWLAEGKPCVCMHCGDVSHGVEQMKHHTVSCMENPANQRAASAESTATAMLVRLEGATALLRDIETHLDVFGGGDALLREVRAFLAPSTPRAEGPNRGA